MTGQEALGLVQESRKALRRAYRAGKRRSAKCPDARSIKHAILLLGTHPSKERCSMILGGLIGAVVGDS